MDQARSDRFVAKADTPKGCLNSRIGILEMPCSRRGLAERSHD